MIEVTDQQTTLCDRGTTQTTGACPQTAGATEGFLFYPDSSRPSLVLGSFFPPRAANGRLLTTNTSSPLQFEVGDQYNATQFHTTELNLSTLVVTRNIAPTTATGEFTLTSYQNSTGESTNASFNRSGALTTANTAYDYTVFIRDFAGNPINTSVATNNTFTMYVDTLDPTVPTIEAIPASQVPGSSPPITGRNVTVRLEAVVNDANMNTASATAVAAKFANTTAGISVNVPMTFNAGKGRWEGNGTVPNTVSGSSALNMTVTVTATDLVGNSATVVNATPSFRVDPAIPAITYLDTPDTYVRNGPHTVTVNVTDDSGYATPQLFVTNTTGAFKPGTFTKITGSENRFFTNMAANGTGNWSANIPDQDDAVALLYNVSVTDRSGNVATTGQASLITDKRAPRLDEALPSTTVPIWRGASPHTLTFTTFDPANASGLASGVDSSSGALFWRLDGETDYTQVNMTLANNIFTGRIVSTFSHEDVVEYYATAKDMVGNAVTNGTSAAPKNYSVDLEAPIVTLNELDPTSTTGQFSLSATATDDGSGVAFVIFEGRFRTGSQAYGNWSRLFTTTSGITDQMCLPGGATYQFRAYGIDNAQNVGNATGEATVEVTGEGCQQTVTVTILQPAAGSLVDADGGSGVTAILWNATTDDPFTGRVLIRIKIEFSPDAGLTYVPVADDLSNTGIYNWTVVAPACTDCRIRLTATLPGAAGSTTVESGAFQVIDGAPTDFNSNGVIDNCELQYFGGLTTIVDAGGDPDLDGLSTQTECDLDPPTDPTKADTDGDGVSDGVEVRTRSNPLDPNDVPTRTEMRFTQMGAYYLIIPALFIAIVIVFLMGITRRW